METFFVENYEAFNFFRVISFNLIKLKLQEPLPVSK